MLIGERTSIWPVGLRKATLDQLLAYHLWSLPGHLLLRLLLLHLHLRPLLRRLLLVRLCHSDLARVLLQPPPGV